MGLSSSSDYFNTVTDEIFGDCDGYQKIVDDILVEGKDYTELATRLRAIFIRARDNGVTFSKDKVQVGDKVSFAGFVVEASSKGPLIFPDPALLIAIRDFPRPTNLKQLRGFCGLAQQVGAWNPDLSQSMVRSRELLKLDSEWIWTDELELEFNNARDLMSGKRALVAFNQMLDTRLITDASRVHGLGFILVQLDPNSKTWHIIKAGSCSLTSTQRNYAVIELEMLGICYACEKCSFFIEGLPSFEIVTDHLPLIGVIRKDLRDVVNPRLHWFREKINHLNFVVSYLEGKHNIVADALSRNPLDGTFQDMEPPSHMDVARKTTNGTMSVARSDKTFGEIFDEAARNDQY